MKDKVTGWIFTAKYLPFRREKIQVKKTVLRLLLGVPAMRPW